jgi:uncharacterized glyoxalase superfamily protein PhnB
MMKNTPKGWPRISAALFYDDAGSAIDWLCRAFGFQVRLRVDGEGGRIEHSELTYGDDGLIMVGTAGGPRKTSMVSPKSVGGRTTQSLMLFVDDVDAHCAGARAAGATITMEPAVHDYGDDHWADRSYGALDLEGHNWWFTQRVRDKKE